MKVHLRDQIKDLSQIAEDLFHFLMRLTQEKNYAHQGPVSFFNEIDTVKGTILMGLFHFLTRLTQ